MGQAGRARGRAGVAVAVPASPATPATPAAGLRREWVLAFVVGELVGFLAPALVGVTLVALRITDAPAAAALTAAGVVEGAVLGMAQRLVLARHAPAVDGHAWVVATAGAAGFAWFVGMGGSVVLGARDAPHYLLLGPLAVAWAAALLSMGYLQWRVLRRVVPDSGRWVWVTAGAWLAGVTIPIAALSAMPESWSSTLHVGVAVLAAVAMGLVVGTLTGGTLVRLLRGGAGHPVR